MVREKMGVPCQHLLRIIVKRNLNLLEYVNSFYLIDRGIVMLNSEDSKVFQDVKEWDRKIFFKHFRRPNDENLYTRANKNYRKVGLTISDEAIN